VGYYRGLCLDAPVSLSKYIIGHGVDSDGTCVFYLYRRDEFDGTVARQLAPFGILYAPYWIAKNESREVLEKAIEHLESVEMNQ
jgi:hypothetical protein